MYRIPVVSLRLVRDKTVPYYKKIISQPEDAHLLAKELIGDRDREVILLFCLDNKNKIACISEASIGSTNNAFAGPKEILRTALISNATSIIIAHNHPSGDPTPSQDDRTFTQKLKEAAETVGIKILDHLIIGDEKYFSFCEDEGVLF